VNRVVVSGMGIVAPNAIGLDAYQRALREGKSGVSYCPPMRDLDFACHVGGIPPLSDETVRELLDPSIIRNLNTSMTYALIASLECWRDAGMSIPRMDSEVDWNTAAIIGTCAGGVDTLCEFVVPETNSGRVRRLGSNSGEKTMASCTSACIGGVLGLGGQVTTNSSACCTGTEAIVNAYWMIREGRAARVLAGSAESCSVYQWAPLDAMRVTMRKSNDRPEAASRPLSASAGGLVPSGGAGILLLENLESAAARGARIHAELLGGHINSGGQRNGGSITASNPESIHRCVREALEVAKTKPAEIDYINGHLTGTGADAKEIRCLSTALGRSLPEMPWVNATKSMIGHGIGAAGSMETIATVLQLSQGFLHPSINCEDFHPEIAELAPRVPQSSVSVPCQVALKTSFGFGDVNSCTVFKRWAD
jgi:3-oxoacyl-(acyl-carrier-protein) synthase